MLDTPLVLAVAEGNPRLVIGIMTQLLAEVKHVGDGGQAKVIGRESQAQVIEGVVRTYRSLLRTIGYAEDKSPKRNRGILQLLDRIGEAFYRGAILGDFQPEPALVFTIDNSVDESTKEAIGTALNAGAIVYVPIRDDDSVLSSLQGKQFRLNYLLAAHHRLPLILGNERALSSILAEVNENQLPLDLES